MTRQEFARKVLARLGLNDPNSEVPEYQQEEILSTYDSVYLSLKDDGLVTWSQPTEIDDENIPERFVLSLAVMVAAELADSFNIPEQKTLRLINQAIAAKRRINQQLQTGQDTDTTEAEYF